MSAAPGVSEFVRESARLRGQLKAAELGWRHWLADDVRQELRQLLQPHGSHADRRAEGGDGWRQLVAQVNQVRQRVVRLRQLCQPPLRHQDVAVIQRVADSVRRQAVTASQRCGQRQRDLDQQERELAASVDGLCDRVRRWSIRARDKPRAASVPARTRVRPQPQNAAVPAQPSQMEAVAAYDAFLQQYGGPTGGWDEVDHAVFLKLCTRHKGMPRHCQAIAQQMPNKCLSEIVQHVRWYEQLWQLADRRRQAVSEWRETRQAARAATAAAAAAAAELSPPTRLKVKTSVAGSGGAGRAAGRRLRARSPRPSPVSRPLPSARQTSEPERAARRAAVAEYRQRREQERQRLLRQQQQQQQQQRLLRAHLTADTLAVYRRRDAEQMERQKSARQQRSRPSAPAVWPRPSSVPVRCPGRLLADTSATRRRRQASETTPGPVSVGLAAIPRRRVPQWRAGL